MVSPEKISKLVRNKSKRVTLALNPDLWALVEEAAKANHLNPTNLIEDLIITYLVANNRVK
jgi:hypothetical protein